MAVRAATPPAMTARANLVEGSSFMGWGGGLDGFLAAEEREDGEDDEEEEAGSGEAGGGSSVGAEPEKGGGGGGGEKAEGPGGHGERGVQDGFCRTGAKGGCAFLAVDCE